jgi:AraC-like DNA-binding protein
LEDTFKYLATSEEDQAWGLFLNSFGRLHVPPGTSYPSDRHPSGYYYTWEEGRRLSEYQINYIVDGAGIYENSGGSFRIQQGSLMVTQPGDWHRYMPLKSTGWTEMYIGFNGPLAQKLMVHSAINSGQPVFEIGTREDVLAIYLEIFDLAKNEQPGFQQIASGLIVKMLGTIVAFEKQKGFAGKPIAAVIGEACFIMRKDVDKYPDLVSFASRHNISYSYFRRMFKKFTGVSPLQYQMQLKMILARELLVNTGKTVKEISYSLGFESIHYFSRLFKEKVGDSPNKYRKKGDSQTGTRD